MCWTRLEAGLDPRVSPVLFWFLVDFLWLCWFSMFGPRWSLTCCGFGLLPEERPRPVQPHRSGRDLGSHRSGSDQNPDSLTEFLQENLRFSCAEAQLMVSLQQHRSPSGCGRAQMSVWIRTGLWIRRTHCWCETEKDNLQL